MDVLIVGLSSIVKRRVLPALLSVPGIHRISISSRHPPSPSVIPEEKRGEVFSGYSDAIMNCKPCLAYVSLPNSMHVEWAIKLIESGFNVIIDKPAVTEFEDARNLVGLADAKGLCIAEANAWHYHSITREITGLISREEKPPIALLQTFLSPALDPNNFRYNMLMGGGILLDRGSYVASCGRLFFGEEPDEIVCRITPFDLRGDVDISANIMMTYPRGSVMHSVISLGAEYRNGISVLGTSYAIDAERIFTPPSDYTGVINIRRDDETKCIQTDKCDIFKLFIEDILSSLEKSDFRKFGHVLLQDARVLSRIIRSARGER